jgi:hypothetical protein
VRVGRAPLDDEAIRLIEEHNPDVAFDWTRILKGEPPERRPNEPAEESASPAQPAAAAATPAVAEEKIGADGLARLRARFAELLARISDVPDPVRREELKTRAQRLNPDAWETQGDVTRGLEGYEAEFESIRTGLARRRRRRRSRRGRQEPVAAPDAGVPQEPADDLDDDEAPDPEAG